MFDLNSLFVALLVNGISSAFLLRRRANSRNGGFTSNHIPLSSLRFLYVDTVDKELVLSTKIHKD